MSDRPDIRSPHVLALLDARLKQRGDLQRVAEQLQVSHTYLSLYRAARLRSVGALEARILVAFDRYPCPHDGTQKQPLDCKRIGLRPRPRGWHEAEAAWLACQSCTHLDVIRPLALNPPKPLVTKQTRRKS